MTEIAAAASRNTDLLYMLAILAGVVVLFFWNDL